MSRSLCMLPSHRFSPHLPNIPPYSLHVQCSKSYHFGIFPAYNPAERLASSRPETRCHGAKRAVVEAVVAAAPAAPVTSAQHTQVIFKALLAPVASFFGGESSWQFYLVQRFFSEVVAVAATALLGYWLLTLLAKRSAEHHEGGGSTAAHPGGRRGGGGGSHSSSVGLGGGEVLFMAADALTTPMARVLLTSVLVIHAARNITYIFDGFITVFNPRLPNDWLDDLVRLMVQSLTPLDGLLTKMSMVCLVLCSCAVLLRWKDILLSHYLLPHVEAMDKGPELVANFFNPASNILNWIVIVASVVWLAMALGINLKPFLAVGGASGIIIGLATQQVLSNFVSGLNIFLARPFVAGEYISLISQNLTSQTNVSGRVIRVDPMRTLIATEDNSTITVPNQVIAISIVINRTRSPHWSVGKPSSVLANPRELHWRMRLPHAALDKLQEVEARIEETLQKALPEDKVRHSTTKLMVVKFIESGVEFTAKVNLAWRMGVAASAHPPLERKEKQEELIQHAMLSLQKVVRSYDGTFMTPA
ncbi:hypothetical protein Vretifemale_12289 [Volvox reticuliferus]|uniref:Mechanosensitive ion channel MscS domain-containing protein n=1 Tax=Volvox reticuliferus TaxID=1737510 RepID=A0A8J4FTG3_9CHLO|nr:hypothetical protein Vretifemale_12289 [Volvox reticuliferus]